MDEDMILPLTDADGNEINFEVFDSIAIEEMGEYFFLVEEEKNPERDGIEILKVIPGDGDEDTLVVIGDEEFEKVLDAYNSSSDQEDCDCGCNHNND